mgnify:CR=1 FL=1
MSADEIREKFLAYFAAAPRGHTIIPSASLVPENDPTTLFTGSGMQPLVPYLLGENHPAGSRLANAQKCFRAIDIEEVGDNRHTTFFEMLGNWSLGDYFKKEQLAWFYEFITREIGLPPERLAVTCFAGDEKFGLPRDEESATIWRDLGLAPERIHFYGGEKNWWSRSGRPDNMPAGEPGGPDSEIFYEFTSVAHDPRFGEKCHPNCDCGRFLEIGNSVFMQFVKNSGADSGPAAFGLLPKRNVDFGGGLERITAAANDEPDVFKVGVLRLAIESIEKEKPHSSYERAAEYQSAFRIIADHLRAAIFLIGDGILPAKSDRGYFVRRLIRRATLHKNRFLPTALFSNIVFAIAEGYKDEYPELRQKQDRILEIISKEETEFEKTLVRGLWEFEKLPHRGGVVSGVDAFNLYTAHGFPVELTQEVAKEYKATVDVGAFRVEMEKHKLISRAGAEQKFKGGLADHSEQTTRLHTAHHLLLKALQVVLGPRVKQRGSNITQERLRLDFLHGEKMTEEQKKKVAEIVNEKIGEKLPVIRSELDLAEAEKLGAEHEFGQKYPERVSVYSIGPADASVDYPQFSQVFSIEFCGGPHVANTGELAGPDGKLIFKILKEEAVAAGIRRIKAVLIK